MFLLFVEVCDIHEDAEKGCNMHNWNENPVIWTLYSRNIPRSPDNKQWFDFTCINIVGMFPRCSMHEMGLTTGPWSLQMLNTLLWRASMYEWKKENTVTQKICSQNCCCGWNSWMVSWWIQFNGVYWIDWYSCWTVGLGSCLDWQLR